MGMKGRRKKKIIRRKKVPAKMKGFSRSKSG
jgi:hypothetical protein